MKRLLLGLVFAMCSTMSFAAQFGPLPAPAHACLGPAAIHNPHCVPKASPGHPPGNRGGTTGTSGNNSSGGSWRGFSHALAMTGAGCLASHIGQWIFVGITENRDRTDKEADLVWVGCTWGLYGIVYWQKWGDGTRKPRPLQHVYKSHDAVF